MTLRSITIALVCLLSLTITPAVATGSPPHVLAVTPTATPRPPVADAVPYAAEPATVVQIIDGDTIMVMFDSATAAETVRLLLMDTPETVDPRYPVQCFGPEAGARMADLLPLGTTVYLERDVTHRDRYQRLLRYVWLVIDGDDAMAGTAGYAPGAHLVNELMVREGYAVLSTYPPDVAYVDVIRDAQAAAIAADAGLWGACGGPDVPLADVTPTAVAAAAVADRAPVETPSDVVADGIDLVSLTSPVTRGGTASIVVVTTAGALCEITVTYASGPSSAGGLEPRLAGPNGRVAWSWTVGTRTALGEWPIAVVCGGVMLHMTFEVVS